MFFFFFFFFFEEFSIYLAFESNSVPVFYVRDAGMEFLGYFTVKIMKYG